MKRLLLALALMTISAICYAQPQYPINQTIGAPTTLVTSRGGFKADSSFIVPYYSDTAKANISPYGKNYAGAVIRVGDSLYMRNASATKWINLSQSGGGGGNSWLVGGNTDAIPPYIGNIDQKELDFITFNSVRMRIPSSGIVRGSAGAKKYLLLDTITKYLYYGDAGGGNGTVTSISQGYGIIASPNPITTSGTISADTITLNNRYMRAADSSKYVQSVTALTDTTFSVKKNNISATITLVPNLQTVLNKGNLSYQKSVLIIDSVNTGASANTVAVLSSKDSIRGSTSPYFVGLEKRFTTNYATLEFDKTTYINKLLPILKLSSSDLDKEFRATSEKLFFKKLSGGGTTFYVQPPNTLTNNTLTLPNTTGTLIAKINGNSPDSTGNITISTGSGTVTSVATGYGLSGGTITTSGTLIADTSVSGLSGKYVRISDTSSMLSPYLRKVDTASLSNRINLKLNISDTSSMLSPYLRKIDTTNKWVNNITRTLGKDSIIYYIGNTRYAIKDSVGTNPPASGYYLSISDSTTQDNPTANTPRAVKFNTTDLANGFSLNTQTAVFVGTINNGGAGAGTTLNVTSLTSGKIKVGMVLTNGSITAGTFISAFISGSGGIGTYEVSVSQLKTSATYTGTMTSQIVCANTGIYNLQFSSQMDKSDAGVDYVNFWLRKNGTDITASAGVISLQGNNPAYMMAAWNYVIQLVAGDTIELYWGSADINMSIRAEASQTTPLVHPAVQSTIFTITQQAGILAGTGITAINSLTGSAQTMVTGTDSTDFKIVSTGTSHTFNLPTASATNRGALSSANWTTFNSKIGPGDTATMLSPYLRKVDTASLSNRINLKVNISDTATMLSKYLRKTDTASLSNRINLKLNISDTAAMLANYVQSVPTIAYLGSDFTTSSTTAVSTNLSIAVAANTAYRIMINGSASKATSATGLKVSISAPAGTTIKANFSYGANALNTIQNAFITAINTLYPSTGFSTAVATEVPFRIEGILVTSSTPGNVILQGATVTSNTATIYASTLMTLTKAYSQ